MTATLEEIEQEELKLEQDISDLKAQSVTADPTTAAAGPATDAQPAPDASPISSETPSSAEAVTADTSGSADAGAPAPGAPPPEEAAPETAEKAETIPEIFAADYALLESEVHALAKKIYGEAVTLEEAGKTFLLKLGGEVKHIFCF